MEADKEKGSNASKRKRAVNWDTLEKNLLRSCIKELVSVIENKNTDTNTNQSKKIAWEKITQRFNEINSRQRSIVEIKQQWRTTKLEAKKVVSDFKRERNGTGGGQKPPSPSPGIYEIMDMIPQEFEVDSNKFDSDGVNLMVPVQLNTEACSQISDYGASTSDIVEVFQIIPSPRNDKENIQEIITTPLAANQIDNLGSTNKLKSGAVKRKLPFKATTDLAKQRTEVLTNCVMEEHKLKLQQMRESHEWAREEHLLRLEILKKENLLLHSKINKTMTE